MNDCHFYYVVLYVYALSMFELTTISLSGFIIIHNYELKAKLNPQVYFFKRSSLNFFPLNSYASLSPYTKLSSTKNLDLIRVFKNSSLPFSF